MRVKKNLIIFICFLASILFILPVSADMSLYSKRNLSATDSSSTEVKLALSRWIVDSDSSHDELTFESASSNLFSLAHCEDVSEHSYVKTCISCEEGYILLNGSCEENTCQEYNNSVSEIVTCKDMDSCKKGNTIVYKCKECVPGYKLTNDYKCEKDECINYPFKEKPTNCKGEAKECYHGEDVYYGCESCNLGYSWEKGKCEIIICKNYTLDSCPSNGECDSCQSGSIVTKYKLTSCNAGYTESNNTCVKASGALAFNVKTSGKEQGITLSLEGNYTIDWGDGTVEKRLAGQSESELPAHTYKIPGDYKVQITGEPTGISIKSGQEYITGILDTSLSTIEDYDNIFSNTKEVNQKSITVH